MRTALQRGVPPLEHNALLDRMPDWEAVRIFLEVARSGSFRAAADRLKSSVNHMRRRVDELERDLGVKVFTRHFDGVRMTAEGEKIQTAAAQMEEAAFGMLRTKEAAGHKFEGEVRVAVTEGLGTFWLVPRLVEFQRGYPRLLVDLKCEMRSADVLRLEADVPSRLLNRYRPI